MPTALLSSLVLTRFNRVSGQNQKFWNLKKFWPSSRTRDTILGFVPSCEFVFS